MARQARLSGAGQVNLAVVLDEAALSRPIGGRPVMRARVAFAGAIHQAAPRRGGADAPPDSTAD